jgi:4-hydroxymandelate oxidase
MDEERLSISEIYAKGKENLEKMGLHLPLAPESNLGATGKENRKVLDSLFFEPRFLDPAKAEPGLTLFGRKLKTPAFCSALSKMPFMPENCLVDIAGGIGKAGSLMMLGIGGSRELQEAVDTGAPIVKIVKPYRQTELIYQKVRDAESRGCVAVGMDIDHSLGRLRGDRVDGTDIRGPQRSEELKQVISQTGLPFILKGVLSITDAEKAVEMGASAILVSNHAANSLLFGVPSMIALPRIADRVGTKLTVLVDSGFKTGNDVFKALASGAEAVGFGWPMVLAYMAEGPSGVELLVNQITAELCRTMTAIGCPTLSDIESSSVIRLS